MDGARAHGRGTLHSSASGRAPRMWRPWLFKECGEERGGGDARHEGDVVFRSACALY